MATFNYILGPKKNDGQYPIYLLYVNRWIAMISVRMSLSVLNWNFCNSPDCDNRIIEYILAHYSEDRAKVISDSKM